MDVPARIIATMRSKSKRHSQRLFGFPNNLDYRICLPIRNSIAEAESQVLYPSWDYVK
jgi:hypothetical protein